MYPSQVAAKNVRKYDLSDEENSKLSKQESITDIKVLQHFEYAVMNAVESLNEAAFPAEIARRLSKELERHVSLAQVFLTLERLKNKGLVTSRDSHPEPVRGGRRRRIFRVEASGAQALEYTAAAFRTSPPSKVRRSDERTQEGPTARPAVA